MNRITRRTILGAAGATVLSAPAIRAQGGGGVALVIGNSKYMWEAQLPNVKRDVPDMARRFQEYGLKTELLQDIGRDEMRRAADAFLKALKGANFAAFYFAGHGITWEYDAYLVPVDSDLSAPNAVANLLPVPLIRDGIGGATHGLIALDNCRNNPADGWRQRQALDRATGSTSQGGGRRPPPNTLMLFSTAPGRVAVDGPPGENSPFAAALLHQFEGTSVEFQGMGARLRRDLLISTRGRQVLWDRDTYDQPFRLAGKAGAAPRRAAGWAGDPSKIVEIPNAYAFAQQSGLPLPAGLIAHRPSAGSRDGMKIGTFKFTSFDRTPGLLAVISVEEQQTAEIVMSSRGNNGQPGWRYIQARISGDTIEYTNVDGGRRYVLTWSDAGKGSIAMFGSKQGQGNAAQNGTFTRLDG